MVHFLRIVGLISAVVLPLWNIPLIWRVIKRRSAADISLFWLFGVWLCFIFMLPSALLSTDFVLRAFGVVNIIFFTMVVITVMIYRGRRDGCEEEFRGKK